MHHDSRRKPGHEVAVHAQESVFGPRHVVRKGEKSPSAPGYRSSVPTSRRWGSVCHLSTGPATIANGIMTTGSVPRNGGFEKINSDLRIASDAGLVQDNLPDDKVLVAKTPKELVVLLGCAHRGIVNALVWAR